MTDNPLTIFGDLSKPATVLIEKVSDFVGGALRPYQIRRVAKANVDAQKILAEGDIEISDMQRRALSRVLVEQERDQRNIESIVQKAIPDLRDDAKPETLEDDWMARFFDQSRLVSDEEMQSLWSRILAGEANRPGTFSKRTLSLVSNLDKRDAELFTSVCRFGWVVNGRLCPLIYDSNDSIYVSEGLSFGALTHLDDIGLISFSPLSGYSFKSANSKALASYGGRSFRLELVERDKKSFAAGKVLLTQDGSKLASICNAPVVEGMVEYMLEKWREDTRHIKSVEEILG
jgi:hypothetical protein